MRDRRDAWGDVVDPDRTPSAFDAGQLRECALNVPERRSGYRRLLDALRLRRTKPQRAQHPERDLSGH